MKNTPQPPRRKHHRKTDELRRIILQALQAPVPPQLKSWVRI